MDGEARRGAETGADNASMGYLLTAGVMEEVLEKLFLTNSSVKRNDFLYPVNIKTY